MAEARPILKWAGGKGQLLDRLQPLFPPRFNRYIEPFAGAGAVFFRLFNLGQIGANPRLRRSPAILNDLNAELMNVYLAVRDHLDELIDELARHQAHTGDPDYYYYIRDLDREPDYAQQRVAIRAARTIFLNKTCYNGLYRVNRGGYFNVPFGQHKNPAVLDQALLHASQRALQNIQLMCSDFVQPLRMARQGDFIYIDPPSHPVNDTSFTSYTSDGFDWEDQKRLATWIARLTNRGCYVLVNNTNAKEIRDLYRSAFTHTMTLSMRQHRTKRNINSNGQDRGGSTELTAWNY